MAICEFLVFLTVSQYLFRVSLKKRTMDKVDATMAAVNEQRELANEIADTIATPLYTTEIDDVCSPRTYSSSIIADFFI
jgi:hypothetical protein